VRGIENHHIATTRYATYDALDVANEHWEALAVEMCGVPSDKVAACLANAPGVVVTCTNEFIEFVRAHKPTVF
jgi:hypothetical protein